MIYIRYLKMRFVTRYLKSCLPGRLATVEASGRVHFCCETTLIEKNLFLLLTYANCGKNFKNVLLKVCTAIKVSLFTHNPTKTWFLSLFKCLRKNGCSAADACASLVEEKINLNLNKNFIRGISLQTLEVFSQKNPYVLEPVIVFVTKKYPTVETLDSLHLEGLQVLTQHLSKTIFLEAAIERGNATLYLLKTQHQTKVSTKNQLPGATEPHIEPRRECEHLSTKAKTFPEALEPVIELIARTFCNNAASELGLPCKEPPVVDNSVKPLSIMLLANHGGTSSDKSFKYNDHHLNLVVFFITFFSTQNNTQKLAEVARRLLLRCGDVAENPGPPLQKAPLRTISYNVRGLGDERKLRHLLNFMHQQKGSKNSDFIACLQETYIEKPNKIPYIWRGNFHLTPGNGHSCGMGPT